MLAILSTLLTLELITFGKEHTILPGALVYNMFVVFADTNSKMADGSMATITIPQGTFFIVKRLHIRFERWSRK